MGEGFVTDPPFGIIILLAPVVTTPLVSTRELVMVVLPPIDDIPAALLIIKL